MAYNLNAARAQRAEAKGTAFEFTLDGDTFSMPLELDRKVVKALREVDQSDLDASFACILGAETYAKMCEHDLSVQDLRDLMAAFQRAAALTPGESRTSALS